jgi:hypothetical protein
MFEQIHHQRTVSVGGKNVSYTITEGLFDQTLFVAAGHADTLSPDDIIKHGPPQFLESAFENFKKENPYILDTATLHTTFAQFVKDIASGKWQKHHEEYWKERLRKKPYENRNHVRD